jgi:hypothetical protein
LNHEPRQNAHFSFDGDQLILDAETEWGNVHIVWQKVAAHTS